MSTENRVSIPGIVRDGVVVPTSDAPLPDGTHVEISIESSLISSELKAEMRSWDAASDEAWDMMETWEKEAQ